MSPHPHYCYLYGWRCSGGLSFRGWWYGALIAMDRVINDRWTPLSPTSSFPWVCIYWLHGTQARILLKYNMWKQRLLKKRIHYQVRWLMTPLSPWLLASIAVASYPGPFYGTKWMCLIWYRCEPENSQRIKCFDKGESYHKSMFALMIVVDVDVRIVVIYNF